MSVENYEQICNGILDECLTTLLKSELRYGVAASRAHAMNCPSIGNEKIYCLKGTMPNNVIINYPLQMVVRNDFFMTDQFNELIFRFIENGFVAIKAKNFQIQNAIRHEAIRTEKINLEQLSAIFLAYIVSMMVAGLTLILENIMYRSIQKGTITPRMNQFNRIILQPGRSIFNSYN